ncbi:diguanylate cyclase [Marinomonas sp. 5E14-1]|uniref:tetratricopeptide repeat-containing diguanylate cyclase n=1 Tax=Marinomonas sp. 5E14-1 TaxID=3153922 RepID=UPI003264B65A
MPKEYVLIQYPMTFKYINRKRSILPICVLRYLTYALFSFLCLHVHSSEVTPDTPISEKEILQQALSLFSDKDYEKSAELANQALLLAQDNVNLKTKARTHVLLAELAKKQKNTVQSATHYRQAALTYESMQEFDKQIRYASEYINLLLKTKNYELAHSVVDSLISKVDPHKSDFFNAVALSAKGNVYFAEKSFHKAEIKYSRAIPLLTAPDKTTQKKRGEVFKKMAETHKRLKNREETAFFYKEALTVFTSLNSMKNMARTLNTLAEAERYLENYEEALDYSIRSLAIHEKINDKDGQAKALMGAGIIYRHIGRYEKSLNSIHQAHLLYKKMNDRGGIAKTSNEMGLLYSRLKEFDQARSFYQLTVDQPENQVQPKTLAAALREIAVIDLNSDQYESARIMANKAYDIYKKEKDADKGALTARIIANTYRDQKDDTSAIIYYKESLELAKQAGSKIYQMKAQTPLAAILRDTDTDESIRLLQSALQLSIETDSISHQLYTYRELRKAEKLRKNFESSLSYAEKEISLSLEIQKENEKNKLALERAKLHSHKIEMELESLKEKAQLDKLALEKQTSETAMAEQARRISELNLTKNKYASIALASLLAVCLLVAFYIYSRFIDSNKRNKELDYLAARDPLTNCYNRRILFKFMNRDFADSEQIKEYCIILADIDHFKSINDNYGHSTGDSVLCAAAHILQKNVRKNDIVARFGGEEFCIILPHTTSEKATQIAESLRHKIELHDFDQVSLTCSFGISSTQFDAKTPRELIDQADEALFKSKANGRNLVTLWQAEPNKPE